MASRKELVTLAFILLAALALRLSYLLPFALDRGFDWPDPDHYLMGATILTQDGWDWTLRAVRYEWAGRYFFLPPLYPVFLSMFSVCSDMAAAAQLGQLVLGVAAVGLVYEMGRLVHSVRTGLLAASIYAVWFPGAITAWFYQETLCVPLVLLAFVLYLRASSFTAFGLAGAVFGLAALTRSMPSLLPPPASRGALHRQTRQGSAPLARDRPRLRGFRPPLRHRALDAPGRDHRHREPWGHHYSWPRTPSRKRARAFEQPSPPFSGRREETSSDSSRISTTPFDRCFT